MGHSTEADAVSGNAQLIEPRWARVLMRPYSEWCETMKAVCVDPAAFGYPPGSIVVVRVPPDSVAAVAMGHVPTQKYWRGHDAIYRVHSADSPEGNRWVCEHQIVIGD